MIRVLFVIAIFYSFAFSKYTNNDILVDYQKGNYKRVCRNSVRNRMNAIKDEKVLSIVGDACLRVDYINPLGWIINRLYSKPEYRKNASYFATILLQKKLIYQFMHDNIDISNMRLPRTSYVLS